MNKHQGIQINLSKLRVKYNKILISLSNNLLYGNALVIGICVNGVIYDMYLLLNSNFSLMILISE